MSDIVNEWDHVVLMKSFDSGNMKIIQVKRDTTIHYGKLHFDPSPLIGVRYGSVFQIKDGKMLAVENFESFDVELSESVSNNMTTFGNKTQYSQEKIIKKKKKKSHSNVVTLIRPTLLLVNEMLFARDKIGGLRADILAQILTLSNIQNGSKCMILDHNLGMITSAVMSRILPDGICIQLLQDYEILQTTRKTMNMLNIKETDHPDNLLSITIRDLYKVCKKVDNFACEGEILEERNKAHLQRISELKASQECDHSLDQSQEDELSVSTKKVKIDECKSTINLDELQQTLSRKELNREQRQRERIGAANILKTSRLDFIIIIVQNDHPLPILKMMYRFLVPSGQFVIFSDIQEPLLECYQYLKTGSTAVSLEMSESWLRRYQVLPERTRPEMNTTGYGGFFLSGTKALYGPNVIDDVDRSLMP